MACVDLEPPVPTSTGRRPPGSGSRRTWSRSRSAGTWVCFGRPESRRRSTLRRYGLSVDPSGNEVSVKLQEELMRAELAGRVVPRMSAASTAS